IAVPLPGAYLTYRQPVASSAILLLFQMTTYCFTFSSSANYTTLALNLIAGEQGITRKSANLSSYTGSVWKGLWTALTGAHSSKPSQNETHFFGTAEVNTRGVARKIEPCGARTAGR